MLCRYGEKSEYSLNYNCVRNIVVTEKHGYAENVQKQ